MCGEAGIGKTTFLKKIAVDWSHHVQTGTIHTELDKVPFLLFIEQNENNKFDDLFTIWENQTEIETSHVNVIKEYINDTPDRVTLLLDCLDQVSYKVPSECLKEEVCAKLRFIVTTELQSDMNEPTYKHISLVGLSSSKIKDYIEHYYGQVFSDNQTKGSDLFQILKDSDGIITNAKNPTTLQLICIVNMQYNIQKETNITELLQNYVCLRLGENDQNKGLSKKNILQTNKNQIMNLGKLAFSGVKEGYIMSQFKPEDVRQIEPKAFDMGLMFDLSREKAKFHCQLLQNFLAAYFIVHAESNKGLDVLLNLCNTVEHLTGFLPILIFIMDLSSEMNKQIQEKISKLLNSEKSEQLSHYETFKFLLKMLQSNKNIKFSLPESVVCSKEETQCGKSLQLLFEQDGSRVKSLTIVTDNVENMNQVRYLNAPKLKKLEINFSDNEPNIQGIGKMLVTEEKKKFTKLESFSLTQCHVTDTRTEELLECLKENCPSLSGISFKDSTATLDSVAQLTEYTLRENVKVDIYPDCIAEDDISIVNISKGQSKSGTVKWDAMETIDFSEKEITPEGVHALARIVKSAVKLKRLNLAQCCLGDDMSFSKLIENLSKHCQDLISLNLNNSGISLDSENLLCSQTGVISNLEELYLAHCLNAEDNMMNIIDICVKEKCSLRMLDLSENTINEDAYEALSKCLGLMPRLQKLWLNHCKIKSDFRQLLSNMSFSIEQLELAGNQMEHGTVNNIVEMTKSRQALKCINLSGEDIKQTKTSKSIEESRNTRYGFRESISLKIFFKSLATNCKSLETCDVSYNTLDDDAMHALAIMTKHVPVLRMLSLTHCNRKQDKHIQILVEHLMKNSRSLRGLYLKGNSVYPETLVFLTVFVNSKYGELEIKYPECCSDDPKQFVNLCKGYRYSTESKATMDNQSWADQEELNLKDIKLTENGASALVEIVKHLPNLRSLYLPPNSVNDQDKMQILIRALPNGMENLVLTNNVISKETMEVLVVMLGRAKYLKYLGVRNCRINKDSGTGKLVAVLKESCPMLEKLDLEKNETYPSVLVELNVLRLKISGCNVYFPQNATDSEHLASYLKPPKMKMNDGSDHWQKMKVIDLKGEEPTLHGVQAIEKLLLQTSNITDVLFKKCSISALAGPLRSMSSNCSNIKRLLLQGNKMDSKSQDELCHLLGKVPCLYELNIADCGIKENDKWDKLTTNLKECSELNILDISGNILAASAPMMARIPPFITGLQELYAQQCQIESGFDIFAQSLLNNCKRIRILDFSENNLEENAAQLFTSLNSSLEELKVRNCNIPEAAMCSIKTLIDKENGNLEVLDLSGNACDPEILKELTVLSNRFSTRIEFPQCSTDDTESVLSLLQESPTWNTNKEISLPSVDFSQKGLSGVVDVIRQSPSLEILNVANSRVLEHGKRTNWSDRSLENLLESVVSANLQSLNLSGHIFSSVTIPKLTTLVKTKPLLKNIHLRKCHLSDNEEMKLFLHAVQDKCINIESIDLSENECCAEVIAMLTKMKLPSTGYPRCEPKESDKLLSLLESRDTPWERLETVDLSEIVISEPYGVDGLAYMVESLHQLSYFSIMNSKVNDRDCQQKLIGNLSENCELLKHLNLGGNRLNEKSINKLEEKISTFSELRSLNISSCANNCDLALRGIIDQLSKPDACSHLTVLDLSDNICEAATIAKLAIYCHDKGVKANHPTCVADDEAVIKYLRDHSDWKNIHRLDLTEQAVSKSALIGLASVTPYMVELQELLFSKCQTGDNLELANLIRSLEDKAPKMKHMDFSFIPLTGDPIEAMEKLMCKGSSLETLNLENCKLVKEKQFECFTKQLADSCSNLKTLNMSNNPLGDDGFAAMAGTLKNLQHIETLLLEETELKSCSEVISAIRENCKHIHTLSLKGNSASMVDIFDLTKMIVDKRIKRKNLQYPDCEHTKTPKLLDLIKSETTPWEKLDKIDLAQEIIPEDGVEALAMVLQVTKEVKVINLNGCRFDKPEATNEILKAISCNCASLESLDISKTAVTKEGSQHATKIVESSLNLASLELSNCDIGKEACDAIITSIAKRKELLKSVNFSGTKASPKSLVALTKMKINGCSILGPYPSCCLQEDERLINILVAKIHPWDTQEEIDISNPEHISSEGFCALVQVIKESPKLTGLNLDSCGIQSDDNISSCLEALNGKAVNLKMLNLTNNLIGSKGWESLVSASSTFPSLLHLYLRNTKIDKFTATFAEKFEKLSKHLTDLKTLDVSGNSFGKFATELPKLFSKTETLQLENCKLHDSDILELSTEIGQLQNRSLACLNLSKNKALPTTLVHLAKLKLKQVDYPDCESSPAPAELSEIFCNKNNRWQNIRNVNIQKISKNGILALTEVIKESKDMQSFFMSECISEDPKPIASLLGAISGCCKNLETLIIGNNRLEYLSYSTIYDIVITSTKMRTFDIKRCQIMEKPAMDKILKGLLKHKDTLVNVDISENPISIAGLEDLVNLAEQGKHLQSISLAKCNFEDMAKLGKLVDNFSQNCPELKTVDLTGETVSLHVCMKLKGLETSRKVKVFYPLCKDSRALAKYCMDDLKNVYCIDLKDADLTSEGFDDLQQLCKQAENLETLWLPACPGISDKKLSALLDAFNPGFLKKWLGPKKMLTDLDMSNNTLGLYSVASIQGTPLTRLRLAACNLTADASEALVKTLCTTCSNLSMLDLSSNCLPEKSVQTFSTTKRFAMKNIKQLYLSNCQIPVKSMAGFTNFILENCKSLKELDLSGNSCTPDVLVQLTIKKKERAFALGYPKCTSDTAEFLEFCKDTKNEWSEIKHLGKDNYLQKTSYKGSVALAIIFEYTRKLKSLELSDMSGKIQPVIQSLAVNCDSLEKLIISETDICSTTEKQWKDIFKSKSKLTHVKFIRCKLLCENENSIFENALLVCYPLNILDLSDSYISPKGKEHLNQLLISKQTLKEVYLSGIGDVSVFTPAKYNELEKLDLGRCQADPLTLTALTLHSMKFGSKIVRPECSTTEKKEMLDILNGHTPWESLDNLEIGEISEIACKSLSYILKYAKVCKALRLKEMHGTNMALITESLTRPDSCVALEDLSVIETDLSLTSVTQWKQLFEVKSKLHHLTFSKCELFCKGNQSIFSQAKNTKNQLKVVNISECYWFTKEIGHFNNFLIASPQLVKVTVKHSGDVSGLTPDQYSNKLKTMDFEGCTANPYTLALLCERSFKTNINLFPRCSTKDGKELENVYNGTRKWLDLKHFDIGNISEEGCQAFSVIFKYTKACKSLTLKEVSKTNMKLITESLSKPELCEALEKLSVIKTDLSVTTETQWKQLFEVKTKLGHLSFSKCELFCEGNKSIFNQAKNRSKPLKMLDISECSLDPENINHFLMNSQKMTNINLKHSGDISGLTPAKFSKNMETLNFEGCTAKPHTLALLAEHSMTSVNTEIQQAPNCSTEDAKDLVDLYNGEAQWSELDHMDVDKISDEGCMALLVILPYTKACKFLYLKDITRTGMKIITEILSRSEHCAAMKELHVIKTDLSLTMEQQWKNLFGGKSKLSHVTFSKCKLLCQDNISIFRQALSKCKKLETLDISECPLSSSEVKHFNNYLSTSPNLANVKLTHAGDVSGLTSAKYSKQLQTLDFAGCIANPYTLALLAEHSMISTIELKQLPGCSTKDGKILVDMYNGTTKWSDIGHLVIDDSLSPSGGQALGLIINHAYSLKDIDLNESKCYSGEAVANIFKGIQMHQTSLETINFHNCKMDSEEKCFKEILKQVPYLPQLKVLNIGRCRSRFCLISLMTKLNHIAGLQKLDFSEAECDFQTFEKLQKLEAYMSKQIIYKPPRLIHRDEITQKKFQKLLSLSESDLKTETTLDLSECQITNENLIFIENILEKSPSLTKFTLAYCTGVESKGKPFQDMLKQLIKLDKLEILNLSGIEIENSSIQTLRRISSKTKWKEVYLNRCYITFVTGLLNVLKDKCPNLTKLHMQGIVFKVTDLETLTSLIVACPAIVDLNISECTIDHKKSKYQGLSHDDIFLELLKEIEKSRTSKRTINVGKTFDAKYFEKLKITTKDYYHNYIF